jgi:hypothetical protein
MMLLNVNRSFYPSDVLSPYIENYIQSFSMTDGEIGNFAIDSLKKLKTTIQVLFTLQDMCNKGLTNFRIM